MPGSRMPEMSGTGATTVTSGAVPGSSRPSAARRPRSAQSGFGWVTWRRSTAISCRNTKISRSFEASLRASSASQTNERDTARYTRRKSTSAEDRSPAQMLRPPRPPPASRPRPLTGRDPVTAQRMRRSRQLRPPRPDHPVADLSQEQSRAPARPRRPHQRVRASCIDAQVRTVSRVPEPHRPWICPDAQLAAGSGDSRGPGASHGLDPRRNPASLQ